MTLREATTKIDIERTIARLQNEMSDIVMRKMEVQNELSEINGRFKEQDGEYFARDEYQKLVRRQTQLKSDLFDYERQITDRKQRVRTLFVERQALKALPEGELADESKVIASLRYLRNKYAGMASDKTRLDAVRGLAEQISDELSQVILKHVRASAE